ncbi:hypothetical protein D3C72_900240 [compost metagenome]
MAANQQVAGGVFARRPLRFLRHVFAQRLELVGLGFIEAEIQAMLEPERRELGRA